MVKIAALASLVYVMTIVLAASFMWEVGRKAARDEVLRYDQLLMAERESTATLKHELDVARADLEEAKAQSAREAQEASRVRQAGEAQADKERESASRERAKGAALAQDLLVARSEIDVLRKNRAQSIARREEALRRELAAAEGRLDAMRRAADVASAQGRALAEEQRRGLEERQQRAEGLARELRLARVEMESMKAKEALAMRESAAAHKARHAAEAALAEARQAAFLRLVDALEARAKLAAAALAANQAAKSAAKQAAEALVLERARTDSVARALAAARQERDAAKEELGRLLAAHGKALEQERDRVAALSRDLAAARSEIDEFRTREARATTSRRMSKARAADRAKPRASTPARKEARQAQVRKPPRTTRLTIALPDVLLPTQRAIPGRSP